MTTLNYFSLIITFTLFLTPIFAQENLKMQVLDESRLYLEGKTNINQFSCNCTEKFPAKEIQFNSTPENKTAHFDKTEMEITTTKLDCGKKAINKDLAEALKAEQHPKIKLELCSLTFPEAAHSEAWQKVKAETFLTIAGTTRTVNMMVQARQSGQNEYQIKASKELKMTDFGIDPPTALLGLIKVKDDITLHFDLAVRIMEESAESISGK